MAQSSKPRRRLSVRLVAFFISVLVAAAGAMALELGAWAVLRAKGKTKEAFATRYRVDPHVVFAPFVGPRYKPLRAGVRTLLDTDRYGFVHNGDPMRDLSTKPEGTYRIFVLGGSPVVGEGPPGDTIAAQLEQRLNADPARPAGRHYEVICAAMEGSLTSQDLATLEFYLPEYQPDLVISVSGFNDAFHVIRAPVEHFLPNVSGHVSNIDAAAYTHTYSIGGTFAQAFGLMRARSYFAWFADETAASIRAHLPGGTPTAAAELRPVDLGPDPYRYLRRNVSMMIGASRTLGAAHVAVFMPTVLVSNSADKPYRQVWIADIGSRFRPTDYWGAMEQLYRNGEAIYRDLSARFDDGRTAVVRDYSHMFDQETTPSYIGESHYTAAGNAAIAARLADDLHATILSPSSARR
jgi:hypothetical protein